MEKCFNCSGQIKDYYRINSLEYCELNCYYEDQSLKKAGKKLIEILDEYEDQKGKQSLKTTKRYKADKKAQKQKGLPKKKSKQTKRSSKGRS